MAPSGDVAYAARLASGHQLVIVDSLGSLLQEVGPEGEGPGEVRTPLPFHLDERVLKAVDLQTLRVTTWLRGSDSVWTQPLATTIMPQAELAGRWLAVEVTEHGRVPVSAMVTDSVRWQPIPTNDPLVDSLMGEAARRGGRPNVALWADGFIVADPLTYRLALLDAAGSVIHRYSRSLPPNLPSAAEVDREVARLRGLTRNGQPRYDEARLGAIADSLRTTPRPWFTVSSSGMLDGDGRLWVVGSVGDSVFADVFDRDGFIGRHDIACPEYSGRWAVNGAWLALVCAPVLASEPVDAVVRLFRIGD